MLEKTVRDMVGVLAMSAPRRLKLLPTGTRLPPTITAPSDKSGSTTYGRVRRSDAPTMALAPALAARLPSNTAIGQALTAKDSAALIKQMKVLYSQNVLRYANLIDGAIRANTEYTMSSLRARLSGILKPWMKDYEKGVRRDVQHRVHPQAANNYNYCIAKKYIDGFLTRPPWAPPTRPPPSAISMRLPA